MSTGQSRKRAAVSGEGGSADSMKCISVPKRTPRTRAKVKIEIEEEEEVTSKYFDDKKGNAQTTDSKEENSPESAPKVKTEKKKKKEDTSKYFAEGSNAKETGASASYEKSPAKSPKNTSPAKAKKEVQVEPPKDWQTVLENIRIMRSSKTAAVDTMGCERTADLKEEPKVQRFQTLISLMLSSQTRDPVTYAAMERLKEKGLTVQSMLEVEESELAEIIKPVSFYKRKAIYIKKTSTILREQYEDDIPKTVEDLCALPGVGPKMAYICMNAAWNENAGIGVDTHVHRITNRLKWTGKKGTSTPEKTREALESWLPKDLWQEVNVLLVGFGQETCLPIGPKCQSCLNKSICPSSTAQKSAISKKKDVS